jgi:hypothetical protein
VANIARTLPTKLYVATLSVRAEEIRHIISSKGDPTPLCGAVVMNRRACAPAQHDRAELCTRCVQKYMRRTHPGLYAGWNAPAVAAPPPSSAPAPAAEQLRLDAEEEEGPADRPAP